MDAWARYDAWKTTDPNDTLANSMAGDAYSDAGYCDPTLASKIAVFEQVIGPLMTWLEAGTEGWDEAPAFYRWLVEGVAVEQDYLEGEICDDWVERACAYEIPNDWESIESIENMRVLTSTDVVESIAY